MSRRHVSIFILVAALLLGHIQLIFAQEETKGKMILPPMPVFNPHWQFGVGAGAGYDRGEASFEQLLTPTFQVSGAYHFNEWMALQLSVSGLKAKNQIVLERKTYSWNFIQPMLELKVDLRSLLGGWKADRRFVPYALAGIGTNITYSNQDAKGQKQNNGNEEKSGFSKIWNGSRFNTAFRFGLGAQYWLNEHWALTADVNANMLPDSYNSKQGTRPVRNASSRDWRFNALLGVTYRLGKEYNVTEPLYARPKPVAKPVEEKPQLITRDMAELVVNINFTINQSVLRPSESEKLNKLYEFLVTHPEVHILLTGYADKETGTPAINERLSRERSAAVANYLRRRGIFDGRIHTDHKGDRIQPYDFPAANRVCICIVLNSKYL